MSTKYNVIIPAAGRSSRSGLNYPKSLYKIGGIPILVRICRLLSGYDPHPIIIINPDHKEQFEEVFTEYDVHPRLVFQDQPLGMGHALLQADSITEKDSNIILVWSDIPLLNEFTIKHLVDSHNMACNDFSMATALCESCYTIVQRENGKVKGVIETRAAGIPPGKDGEREIGLFVFKKGPVFELLKQHVEFAEVNGKKEQGFLYIIEKIVAAGYRVEGYPIAREQDVLSFNTPEDLKAIEDHFNIGSINAAKQ